MFNVIFWISRRTVGPQKGITYVLETYGFDMLRNEGWWSPLSFP